MNEGLSREEELKQREEALEKIKQSRKERSVDELIDSAKSPSFLSIRHLLSGGFLRSWLSKLDVQEQNQDLDPEDLLKKGNNLLVNKRFKDAIFLFEIASNLRPDDPNILMNWGAALIEPGYAKKAIEKLRRADELHPDDPNILMYWGHALIQCSKYQEANEKLMRADEVRPDDPNILMYWGYALNRCKKPQEALEKLERANELRPDHPFTLSGMAGALLQIKRRVESKRMIKRANELWSGPSPPIVLFRERSIGFFLLTVGIVFLGFLIVNGILLVMLALLKTPPSNSIVILVIIFFNFSLLGLLFFLPWGGLMLPIDILVFNIIGKPTAMYSHSNFSLGEEELFYLGSICLGLSFSGLMGLMMPDILIPPTHDWLPLLILRIGFLMAILSFVSGMVSTITSRKSIEKYVLEEPKIISRENKEVIIQERKERREAIMEKLAKKYKRGNETREKE